MAKNEDPDAVFRDQINVAIAALPSEMTLFDLERVIATMLYSFGVTFDQRERILTNLSARMHEMDLDALAEIDNARIN